MASNLRNDDSSRVSIFVLPQRIQRQRLKDMKIAAEKKKLNVVNTFSSEVTHLVSEFESKEQVLSNVQSSDQDHLEIVKLSWFTECLRQGTTVPVEQRHRIPETNQQPQEEPPAQEQSHFPDWACQRGACLSHHNEKFTKALEILQVKAELSDGDQDYSRALAFRRASCVLKSLPFTVTSMNQLQGLRDMGDHSKRVIRDILEEGFSLEVEDTVNDEWFSKMKLFTSIFGVGPSTAKKWIDLGWNSVEEAKQLYAHKDWRIQNGLEYHYDLTDPVSLHEAEMLLSIVRAEAERILPGVLVQLTGGFRRGKPNGHDIDLLFTHQTEGKEIGFLPRLLNRLEQKNLILCGKQEKNSFTEDVLSKDFKLSVRGQLDHFEKWLGIFKLPQKSFDIENQSNTNTDSRVENCDSVTESLDEYEPGIKKRKLCNTNNPTNKDNGLPRDWKARRVDLIISPISQYYYALVGWTGSKHFNRDLRLYAQRVQHMKLTSHGLFDNEKRKPIPASSEKEVFDHLKLPYFEPKQRNC